MNRIALMLMGVMVLTACGGASADLATDESQSLPVSSLSSRAASPDEQSTAAMSVTCTDAKGDAPTMDIRRATLTHVGDQLVLKVQSSGPVPETDTVGWFVNVSSADGNKAGQLGYRLLDGREMAHFVFDSGTAKQTAVSGVATRKGGDLTVSFPWDFVEALGPGWKASIATTAAGKDLDACPDPGPDVLNPEVMIFK